MAAAQDTPCTTPRGLVRRGPGSTAASGGAVAQPTALGTGADTASIRTACVVTRVASQTFLSLVTSLLPFWASQVLDMGPGEFSSKALVARYAGIALGVFCLGSLGVSFGPRSVMAWCLAVNATLLGLMPVLSQRGLFLPTIGLVSGINSLCLVNSSALVGEAPVLDRPRIYTATKLACQAMIVLFPIATLNGFLVVFPGQYWAIFLLIALAHALAATLLFAWLPSRARTETETGGEGGHREPTTPSEPSLPATPTAVVGVVGTLRIYGRVAQHGDCLVRMLAVHVSNIVCDPVASLLPGRFTGELSATKQAYGRTMSAAGILSFMAILLMRRMMAGRPNNTGPLFFASKLLEGVLALALGLTDSLALTIVLSVAQNATKNASIVAQQTYLSEVDLQKRLLPAYLAMAKVTNCGLRVFASLAIGAMFRWRGAKFTFFSWGLASPAVIALCAHGVRLRNERLGAASLSQRHEAATDKKDL